MKTMKKIVACALALVMVIGFAQILPNNLMQAKAGEGSNFKVWLDDLAKDGAIEPGTVTDTAGGKVTLIGNGTTKYTQEWGNGKNVTRDDKVVNGYKAGARPSACNDLTAIPKAGDGTCVVFEAKATGTFKMYFASTSFLRIWKYNTETGERIPTDETTTWYKDSEVGADFVAYKAEAGYTYAMSTTGKTNNMVYIGYQFIEDEPATVSVEMKNVDANASVLDNLEVYLTDNDLGGEPQAIIKKDVTSADLAKGHTYKVSTNDGGVRALVDGKDTFVCTGDKVTINLYNIPDMTLTGEITGTPEGTVEELTFTNKVNGTTCKATISGSTYTCVMKPGEYTTTVKTTNGGVTYDRVSVKENAENVNEVWVEVPPSDGSVQYVLPELVGASSDLTFSAGIGVNNSTSIKAANGETIVVPVKGVQKVTVSGWYSGTWDINGQNSVTTNSKANATNPTTNSYITNGEETSVTINITGEGTTYLYWVKIENIPEFKSEINVPGDYATMKEAITAINAMQRPEGEEGRITINLTDNLFEQVNMTAPYITLNGNNHEISWYYGVGTNYYSVDPATGLYNERLARDKYSYAEGNGSLWGGVFIVRGNNFIAKDTTFKNTYNYYLTDAELTDIHSTVSGIPERVAGADVTTQKAKERSNAFYIEADNIECYNCQILSSQDTLGRNGSANNNYHTYFKNCVIGGNVDYICGEFSAVFDNCELQWKTYKDDDNNNAKVGYITAPKTSPYVFRNCTVTTDGVGTNVTGFYGRTWGKNSNASFINVETNGLIVADGWGQMSSGDGDGIFKEYNNTKFGEVMYSTGTYSKQENQTMDAVKDYIDTDTVSAVATVLNNWTPVSYKYEVVERVLTILPEEDSILSAVVPSADVVLKDDKDEVVKSGDIKFVQAEASEEQVAALKAAIENQALVVNNDKLTVIDLSLRTIDNRIVKLNNGNIKVSIPKDDTIDYAKYDVLVYHLKDDGTVENLEVILDDANISFTVTSLSPFAITYVEKAADTPVDNNAGSPEQGGGTKTGDTAPITMYVMLAALSVLLLGGYAFYSRKRRA